ISNGRLFFGFGAGWKEIEYDAYGYPFPSIRERMDQMEEAIQIIKLLWTEEKASFEGKYYTIENAISAPKPVQRPMPPIVIGGDGEKRTLRAVAKYADYCNLFPKPELEHKLEVLKKHCEAEGRDYDEVGKSLFAMTYGGVLVTESDDDKEAFFERISEGFGRPIEEARERYQDGLPGSWIGNPDEVIERFQYFIELGFDYFQVMFPGLGEDYVEASRIFSEKVIKKL
ncbi:MAG: LLM class flavin-dependent oxidoreductase, partial [Candidatus Thorarchaeota archaeon]